MITTMAYQRKPDTILWATLSDGNLISMTYDPLQNVIAWARHPMPTGFGEEVTDPGTPVIAAVPATYKFTYISQNGGIYGIPVGDVEMQGGLDAGGVAVDLGTGLVGLPYVGHPFTAGETVIVSNTTSQNGTRTLHASTSADQLVTTDGYVAETFDGTEIVIKVISGLQSGAGRAIMDNVDDRNIYYAHVWWGTNSTYITKIESDGTLVYDYLDMTSTLAAGTMTALTADGQYVYGLVVESRATPRGHVYKWNLSTGALEWATTYIAAWLAWPQYAMDVDSNGNVYVACWGNAAGAKNITKISSDGTEFSKLTNTGKPLDSDITGNPAMNVVVDNTMGIVVVSSSSLVLKSKNKEALMYNLSVRTFDDSDGDTIRLGPYRESPSASYWAVHNLGNANIITTGGFIFAITNDTIFKVSWDGTTLTEEDTVAVSTYAKGLYADLHGNIVVIVQDSGSPQTDVLHFYDTELTSLGSIDGFKNTTLAGWDAAVGGSWQKGHAFPDGALEIPEIPAVAPITTTTLAIGYNSVAVIPSEDKEDEVWMSIGRIVEGQIVRTIERMKPRNWGDDDRYMFFVDSGLTYDGKETTTITGLDHLEGEDVVVLADGAVVPSTTVSSGAITLSESVAIAQVGLPYTYKLKPMRMDQNIGQGTSKGSIKKFSEVVISFFKTLNATYGDGIDFYKVPWRETTVAYGTPPDLFTGDKVVVADAGFHVDDPIEIRGSDPVPCSVRAIIPRIKITGR